MKNSVQVEICSRLIQSLDSKLNRFSQSSVVRPLLGESRAGNRWAKLELQIQTRTSKFKPENSNHKPENSNVERQTRISKHEPPISKLERLEQVLQFVVRAQN